MENKIKYWEKFLSKKFRFWFQWKKADTKAQLWPTCYVGSLPIHEKIKFHDDVPDDESLFILGCNFTSSIIKKNITEAIKASSMIKVRYIALTGCDPLTGKKIEEN